jgi:type VI secretion system secreted protein Hcp
MFDAFLKIDGVEGESTDDAHGKEIDVLSYSWGATQPGTHGAGGGGGAGKGEVHSFHFTMRMSKATPKLMLACATGSHYKEALLTVRKAGETPQEYLTIKLETVYVDSYQTGGSDGSDIPVESISLSFGKASYEYKPQKEDGTLGSPVKVGYDVKAQKKL